MDQSKNTSDQLGLGCLFALGTVLCVVVIIPLSLIFVHERNKRNYENFQYSESRKNTSISRLRERTGDSQSIYTVADKLIFGLIFKDDILYEITDESLWVSIDMLLASSRVYLKCDPDSGIGGSGYFEATKDIVVDCYVSPGLIPDEGSFRVSEIETKVKDDGTRVVTQFRFGFCGVYPSSEDIRGDCPNP